MQRSACMGFCFFVNWIIDYGITRATPKMLTNMGYGAYLLYALLTYLGVVFIFFCLPELKGRSIESMDDLFQRPLWTMWRHAYPTKEETVRHGIQQGKQDAVDGVWEQDGDEEEGAKRKQGVAHIETAS